ncbi:MAG TPA: DUF2147 domain-containing protein [Caulobacteraceae bacterium]|jgi:uncharacterized protein (DUF2147 family)|nr:DUF2147 domain-containing protein [Caulobacteraceae bacterium]
MRRHLQIAALSGFAAIALATGPACAAPVVAGLWMVGDNKGQISIEECGDSLCGRILDAPKIRANADMVDKKNKNPQLRQRRLKGLLILTGFVGGPSEWRNGAVYNPDDGGTYRGTIKLVDEDTIKVAGCIVWPLCKSIKLTRVADQGAAKVEARPEAPPPIAVAKEGG